jgi:hypothetical protein
LNVAEERPVYGVVMLWHEVTVTFNWHGEYNTDKGITRFKYRIITGIEMCRKTLPEYIY